MAQWQGAQRRVGPTLEIPSREPQSSVCPLVPHLETPPPGEKGNPPPSERSMALIV